DLVFSSPPFFDLEIYSDSVEDSYKKYNQESSWYDGFLIPSLRKAASLLIKGGHMVLYIDESINTNYIDKLVRDVNSFMTNKGSIYYFYPNKMVPRRFFVWKK